MLKLKQNNGITLISLIITIILMLLLTEITINIALNGGLFQKAQEAKTGTQLAVDREELQMAVVAALNDDFEILSASEIKLENWRITGNNKGPYTCTSPNENTFTVDIEGNIIEGGNLLGGENDIIFYGPLENGMLLTVDLTSNKIILFQERDDATLYADVILTIDFIMCSVEEAINAVPEEEKAIYQEMARELEENVGKIDSVVICKMPGNNGYETFCGAFLDDKTKIFISGEFGIVESNTVVNYSENPPETIKEVIYKNKSDYKVYIARDISEKIFMSKVEKVDNIIILDNKNETIGLYEYDNKTGVSLGIIRNCSIIKNDKEIIVTLEGVDKTITKDMYKIEIEGGTVPFYLENNGENSGKIYKGKGTFMGLEENEEAMVLNLEEYDISKLGHYNK